MASPSKASPSELVVHIDGASRGNPGPAAYAVVMESAEGAPVTAFSKYLGEATNNFAEYQGLLAALEYALGHEQMHLRVVTDSELLARQINGQYKVKHPGLKPLHEHAQQMIARLKSFSIENVPREENREADQLANRALDEAAGANLDAAVPRTLRTSAIFSQGVLRPHRQLPLEEGEEVELEIHRRK